MSISPRRAVDWNLSNLFDASLLTWAAHLGGSFFVWICQAMFFNFTLLNNDILILTYARFQSFIHATGQVWQVEVSK